MVAVANVDALLAIFPELNIILAIGSQFRRVFAGETTIHSLSFSTAQRFT